MPNLCSILSNMMRKKTSSQVSSACIATPEAWASFSATVSRSGTAPGSQTYSPQRSSFAPVSASSAAQSAMIAS